MKKIFLVMIVLLAAAVIAGCYTVIVHPRVEGDGDYSYRTRYCSDCHGSPDFYYWHWPYYDTWYWRYPHWRSYYCRPWWWSDYWYWKGDSEGPIYQEPRYFDERTRPATPVLPGGSLNIGNEKKTQKDSQAGEAGKKENQGSQPTRYFNERKRPATPVKPDTEKKESKEKEQSGKESEKQEKNAEEDEK